MLLNAWWLVVQFCSVQFIQTQPPNTTTSENIWKKRSKKGVQIRCLFTFCELIQLSRQFERATLTSARLHSTRLGSSLGLGFYEEEAAFCCLLIRLFGQQAFEMMSIICDCKSNECWLVINQKHRVAALAATDFM